MTGKYNDVTGKKSDPATAPAVYVPFVVYNLKMTRVKAAVLNEKKAAYWVTWPDGKRSWVSVDDVFWLQELFPRYTS